MRISDLRAYWIFLTRNKLYTFVSIFGFSISLMFVITLGFYVKQQLSVDDFQEKKDRIFLMTHDYEYNFGNTVAPTLKENFPEIETYVRTYAHHNIDIGKKGTEKIKAKALYADAPFFEVFSIPLIEGNASQVLQGNTSVVVTKSFANKYYPDKNPIGLPIIINNKEYVVTGLMADMPHNTILPEADFIVNYHGLADLWGSDYVLTTSDDFGFVAFLLEKEGADLQSKTPAILDLCKKEFWFYKNGFTSDLKLLLIKDAYFKVETRSDILRTNSFTLITLYTSIAILIFVIALLNYINLTVAQASFRGKEAAIKKLIGCNRKKRVMQLLTESLIMSALTFTIGLFLAFLAEPFFDNVLSTKLDLSNQLTPSVILILFIFIFFVAFVAGIVPALFISSFKPIEVVKGTFNRKVKSGYSNALIIFQYTVAIILLICSFCVKRQIEYMLNYDMGYDRDGVIEMPFVVDINEIDGLKSRLYSIPGVELVSFSCGTPLGGGMNMSFEIDGQQYSLQEFSVDSTFFKIYGISIVESTGIPATTETFWLNRKAYNALNPDPDTYLVQMESCGGRGKKQIAGIMSDFNIRNLKTEEMLLRMSYRPDDVRPWDVIVKLSHGTDYHKVAKQGEKTYSDYSGGELIEATFIDAELQRSYESEKKVSSIISAFTFLTIIIMLMGVFAMSLYLIQQKQKEIGIRKVNGSTETQILKMLNWDSIKRILIAFVIACPIAYYDSIKWLETFPYRASISWLSYVYAGLVVLFLTLLSVSWMTWNAAKANPIDSIKRE